MNNNDKPTEKISTQKTTIWDELNEWGQELPDWRRFILSHAVREGKLNSDRVDEAYKLFLRHCKLDAGKEKIPSLPTSVTGREDFGTSGVLHLKEIRSLKGVNAIPETSKLTFDKGLTIIYGRNGSGKSGFAKILSAACFCRSDHSIIGNVFKSPIEDIPASAEFVLSRGNEEDKTILFTEGEENKDLQRICVFDSSSARIHLDQENSLGFQPVGFDVFDEMTRVINLVKKRLEDDIGVRDKPNKFGNLFSDNGPLVEKIRQINAETDIEELESLSVFGKNEQEQLDEIDHQIAEVRAKSSDAMLKTLSQAKKDISTLTVGIKRLLPHLNKNACESCFALLVEHADAISRAVEAGAEAVKHPNLHRTGSAEWDRFVEASRNLGQTENEFYPQIEDPCLLCHRPLDEASITLVKRMWNFLDDTSRKIMLEVDAKIKNRINALNALNVNLVPLESRIRSDFLKIDSEFVSALDKISGALTERRNFMVCALVENSSELMPKDDIIFPTRLLKKAMAKIENQEKALRQGRFMEILNNLNAENMNLMQRQILSNNIDDIKSYIKDLKWVKEAGNQFSALNTRFVTTKQRDLFRTHIDGTYRNNLDHECQKLDCLLPYTMETRGSVGQTLRKLKVQEVYNPKDIFSEGEQRALALADFLTEVNINPASAAIILDDPVTSMDCQRKKKIAARLADEATNRQVIVFTHDLMFFSILLDHVENNKEISSKEHWIECRDGVPGYVNLGEAPLLTREYRNTTRAEKFLEKAKKSSGREKVDFIKRGAGSLRQTLEVVVIRNLFKNVVQRWDEQVRIGALIKIKWSDDLADEISALQDDTSRLIEGHSNSEESAGGVPEVDTLEELINRVKRAIKKTKQERKKEN